MPETIRQPEAENQGYTITFSRESFDEDRWSVESGELTIVRGWMARRGDSRELYGLRDSEAARLVDDPSVWEDLAQPEANSEAAVRLTAGGDLDKFMWQQLAGDVALSKVLIMCSADPDAQVLVYTMREWEAFANGVKNNEFDDIADPAAYPPTQGVTQGVAETLPES